MCSCEDAEPCEAWSETWPVARKEHQCEECFKPILKGQKHRRVTGIFEGTPFSFRTCQRCLQLSKAFTKAEGCYAPTGMLHEVIRECGVEDRRFWSSFRAALREIRRAAA
jgi:hypothetical protein